MSAKGVPLPDAHKAKLRKAWLSRPPDTPETVERKRVGQIGRVQSQATRDKLRALKTGLRHSASTKRKISVARTQAMAHGVVKVSKLEFVVQSRLEVRGLRYEAQSKQGKYVVDFWSPEMNTVLEVYGCYWHACQPCGKDTHKRPSGAKTAARRRYLDRMKRRYFERRGIRFVVLWEHKVRRWVV